MSLNVIPSLTHKRTRVVTGLGSDAYGEDMNMHGFSMRTCSVGLHLLQLKIETAMLIFVLLVTLEG